MPSENYLLSTLSDVAITKTDDKTKLRTFTGIANSGLPFSYYGERAIVDMSTITLSDKVPALSLHDRNVRLGFGKLSLDGYALKIDGTLLSNDDAVKLAKDADDGFPLQMSAHISAGSREVLQEGQTVVVNGQSYSYPLTILRNCTVPEVSFTPTGVDSNTFAMILSQSFQSNPTNHKENPMTDTNPIPQKGGTIDEAVLAQFAKMQAEIEKLKKELDDSNKEKTALKANAKKASIEAKLSQNGFVKNDKGEYTHLSQASFDLLLSLDDDKVDGVIGDFAKGLPSKGEKDFLLSEQYGGVGGGMVDAVPANPLIADAKARAGA
ncbi:hypothetical protein [Moraxella equi]|uniref:Uncharacterized protein n=1 Tax=Moraxella equi TaxID=60442 RepID=A0A378QW26_9GAMM|nr:hypothetical protein [Moraxella equi]OPH36000.1 hypothetical protein B5J93_09960 [Moraxella equi]STZ03643.1 Uncharacterised protein [Moraxella equi]